MDITDIREYDSLNMIGFLIRKNFFDLWDNLFRIALVNLGFIAITAFPVFVPQLFGTIPFLAMTALLIGILLCFVYLSAAALSLKNISDNGSFGFADFWANLKTIWPVGLFAGGMVSLGIILVTVVIPFYLAMESLWGLMLAAITFWSLVTAVLALQFFFAVRCRLDKSFTGSIKKCFLIFFDNPMFCIFVLIHNLFYLIISVPLALLLPGPAGILLFTDEGLRLRLLKYDWLEANPESVAEGHENQSSPPPAGKRKIPWDVILIDEKEKTGTRSLKNFIFPWKD